MKRLVATILLALAACSSTPAPYVPPPQPPARPGSFVLTADWTAPIGAALKCGGPGLLSPFACDLPQGAKWGVLPQEGNGGMDCVDPEPNVCFKPENGWLGYSTDTYGGMALVSATTLDRSKPMSLEAVVRVDWLNCAGSVAYTGIVDYGGGVDDGDPTGNYAAEYISCHSGDQTPKLWIYTPQRAEAVQGPILVTLGAPHTLRIDWYPGQYRDWWFDGRLVFHELPGWAPSGLSLNHDPHPSLWFGASRGAYQRFDVYAGP